MEERELSLQDLYDKYGVEYLDQLTFNKIIDMFAVQISPEFSRVLFAIIDSNHDDKLSMEEFMDKLAKYITHWKDREYHLNYFLTQIKWNSALA